MDRKQTRNTEGLTPPQPLDFFETIVDPNQEKIMISFDFFKRNEYRLDFANYGFIRDHHGKGIAVRLRKDKEGIYMINGELVANIMNVKVPTKAKIEHEGDRNMFEITFMPDGNIPSHTANVQREVFYISSDDEPKEASDNDLDSEEVEEMEKVEQVQEVEELEEGIDEGRFEKKVTLAMTDFRKPQVLYFSSWVSKTILKGKRKRITLIDPEQSKAYNCIIIAAERYKYEKFLGGEWFKFIRNRGLTEGDRLLFHFDQPPTRLYVEVVPEQNLP